MLFLERPRHPKRKEAANGQREGARGGARRRGGAGTRHEGPAPTAPDRARRRVGTSPTPSFSGFLLWFDRFGLSAMLFHHGIVSAVVELVLLLIGSRPLALSSSRPITVSLRRSARWRRGHLQRGSGGCFGRPLQDPRGHESALRSRAPPQAPRVRGRPNGADAQGTASASRGH